MVKRGVLILGGVVALAVAAAAFTATRAGDTPDKDGKKEYRKVVIFRSGGSWLGVQIADIDADRAKELNLKEEMGAEVQSVSPGSPAEEAGLKKDDVILEYQGTRIESVMQLTRLVHETPAGRTTTIKISRDGATRTMQVKVAEREHEGGPGDYDKMIQMHPGHGEGMKWIQIPEPPEPPDVPDVDLESLNIPGLLEMAGPPSGQRLGAMIDTVGDQLAEHFGVKQGSGVLVTSVRKGGPGEQAGLRAGDVIVKIDDVKVDDTSDLRLAIRERRGKEFKVTLVRDRREQSLTIPAPPVEKSGHSGPGGAPAFDREQMQREIEKARQAALKEAEAIGESARAYAESLKQVQQETEEQIEQQVESARDQADQEVQQQRDRVKEQIRRAVEEARRIRIETQQNAGD